LLLHDEGIDISPQFNVIRPAKGDWAITEVPLADKSGVNANKQRRLRAA